MRLFWVVVSAAAALLTTVTAQSSGVNETLLLGELPSCGLGCLIREIPTSNCSAADLPCICANTELNNMIALCVVQACTIREALMTKNITSTLCEVPVRDSTGTVSITGIVGGVVAVVAFGLRMVSKLPRFGGHFGMDDVVITLVIALTIPLTCLSVVLASHGLGKDMWTVPFDDITYILYVYYFDEDIYLSILPLTKISILFFYLRIFPKKEFRIATWVVIALNVGYLIAFVLISVFQCRPIDAAWLRWDGEYPAQCNNINSQAWAAAAINMFLDIVTMILPLRELSKLSLSLRKKLLVMVMFSLGFFVTVVSALRLHSLIQFANTTNLTWDYVDIGYWSTIEVDVGVICACLPSIRFLLIRTFPGVFQTTNRSGAHTPYYSHTRSVQSGRLDGMIQNRPAKAHDGDFIPLVEVATQSPHGKI